MVSSIGQLISQNSVSNQTGIAGLSTTVAQAIKSAAAKTGVDFSYLLKKAQQESGFNTNAKASTSSATGLYQFTGQTWLRMVKTYGAQYGLSSSANAIKVDASGNAHVDDPNTRKAILAMRQDPTIASEMAGELDKENASSLQQTVGGKIGGTELYLAHFLGAGGASDFLNKMHSNPTASAASVLPDAAAANQSVFYNPDGSARSLKQIYQRFAEKFDSTGTGATALASADTSKYTPTAKTTVATAYQLAQASDNLPSASTGVGSFLSSIGQLKATGNSMMATMIMAQMGVGEVGSNTTGQMSALDTQRKKDAMAILGATA